MPITRFQGIAGIEAATGRLEAMASSRPVVLSSTAAAGINAVDREHFLIADEQKTVGNRVVSLLRDPGQRQMLGRAARAHVEQRYSWTREMSKLEGILNG